MGGNNGQGESPEDVCGGWTSKASNQRMLAYVNMANRKVQYGADRE